MTPPIFSRSIAVGTYDENDTVSPCRRRSLAHNRSIFYVVSRRLSGRSSVTLAEEAQLSAIIEALTEEELEEAACTNYDYLTKAASHSPDARNENAKQFVKRILRGKGHDVKRSVEAIHATLQYRREQAIDQLRLAFHPDGNETIRQGLEKHLSRKMVYVQGYDKEGHSTYIFEPRHVTNEPDELEWTIPCHIWTLEKALACTRARDHKVNAVVNFCDFSTRHAPPTALGIQFMSVLRTHYAGNVHQIFLVDAPRAFLCLWMVFKPFLAHKTKQRIQFVKKQQLDAYYAVDQAPNWMVKNGQRNRELNVHEYLYKTPYDQAFDE
jgi:hypothetical protein